MVSIQMALGINFSIMEILKHVSILCLLAHLLACGFISVDGSLSTTNVSWTKETVNINSNMDKYVAAMYLSLMTMTT